VLIKHNMIVTVDIARTSYMHVLRVKCVILNVKFSLYVIIQASHIIDQSYCVITNGNISSSAMVKALGLRMELVVDQLGFRCGGSTTSGSTTSGSTTACGTTSGTATSAVVDCIHHATHMLEDNSYIRCLLIDFFQAFDVVQHSFCYQNSVVL